MTSEPTDPAGRLLAWPAVRERVGISRTTAWRLQREGSFPKPVMISAGRVGWREEDIIAWAAQLPVRDLSAPRSVGRPAIAVRAEPPEPPPSQASPRLRLRAPKPPNPQLGFDF